MLRRDERQWSLRVWGVDEVTEMEMTGTGEVIASSFDHGASRHVAVAETTLERAETAYHDWRRAGFAERAHLLRAVGAELRRGVEDYASASSSFGVNSATNSSNAVMSASSESSS